jgi:hypothetical protein
MTAAVSYRDGRNRSGIITSSIGRVEVRPDDNRKTVRRKADGPGFGKKRQFVTR